MAFVLGLKPKLSSAESRGDNGVLSSDIERRGAMERGCGVFTLEGSCLGKVADEKETEGVKDEA